MHVIESQIRTLGRITGLFAGLAISTAAFAQDATGDASSLPPDGESIYARDVHHSIGQPYFPGQAHTTVTAPTQMIIETIALGLQPLEDEETASVSALLSAPLVGNAALPDLAQPASALGTSNQLSTTEVAASAINSTIGKSMDSLSQALGALSAIPGANQ